MADMTDTWDPNEFAYLDHDLIDDWREAESPDPDFVKTCREYVEGRQADTLSVEQRKLLQSVLGHPMADNVSRLVVRAAASRLKLEQFAIQDEVDEVGNTIASDAVSALRSWLRRFWLVNQWE